VVKREATDKFSEFLLVYSKQLRFVLLLRPSTESAINGATSMLDCVAGGIMSPCIE
jgi:hypothetical protein